MTREEQIIEIGAQFAIDETDGQTSGRAASMRGVLLSAFRAGAHWADQHPQWRPVDDELPESGETVLANDGKRVVMATYQSGPDLWFRDVMFGCVAFNPTHWMPLPASPATKGGEV